MKTLFLFCLIIFANSLIAQNALKLKYIDSLVSVYSEMAANKKFEVIKGSLLLEGNKTKSIQFLKNGDKVKMIIIEDSLKENVEFYFLQNNKLIFTSTFLNGNLNNINYSVYFLDDTAFMKQNNLLKPVNKQIWITQIEAYFDLFAEQLKI